MSIKSDYQEYLEKKKTISEKRTGKFWMNQEERYVKPFQIYGNLYYVGDSWVCVHIVDTGEGLLMFDAGNCGATAMLVQSIWEMGFNPADVKWIILSHGHADHFGAVNFFKRMFGTKIYMGEPDVKMFHKNPELALIQESGNCMDELFDVDVAIKEGDVLRFGNTEIEFHLVPGHTKGCIACFFDVTDRNEKKRVGYYGGFGFNTLQTDYLKEIGDAAFEARKEYHWSLASVRDQKEIRQMFQSFSLICFLLQFHYTLLGKKMHPQSYDGVALHNESLPDFQVPRLQNQFHKQFSLQRLKFFVQFRRDH